MPEDKKISGTDHVDRESVYMDWKSGMKRKDIAEKYQIKVDTLKSWIARDFKKREDEPSPKEGAPQKEKGVPKKKKGAPKRNKNAVGNKGNPQPRNQNNFKHGAFSSIYWDTLNEEELLLLENMSYDEEQELENQIALLTIREHRLLQQIKRYKDQQSPLDVEQHLESTTEEQEQLIISKISTFEAVSKLESALTQVQGKKTKCIESLHKIRKDKLEYEEKQKSLALVENTENDDVSLDISRLSTEELKELESIFHKYE